MIKYSTTFSVDFLLVRVTPTGMRGPAWTEQLELSALLGIGQQPVVIEEVEVHEEVESSLGGEGVVEEAGGRPPHVEPATVYLTVQDYFSELLDP